MYLLRCVWLILLLGIIEHSVCLYEDQIGKFDWRQNYVGKLIHARFDTSSTTKKIIVATEENVIAALNLKFGQILWRRVLEAGPAGKIRYLSNVVNNELISVSGSVPALVRVWDLTTGNLKNEWTIAEPNPERVKDVKWVLRDKMMHHVMPIFNDGLKITSYDSKTGEKLNTRKISAPFVDQEEPCVLVATHYMCLKGSILFYVNLFDEKAEAQSASINTFFGAGTQAPYKLDVVPGDENAISISAESDQRKRVLIVNENGPEPVNREIAGDSSVYIVGIENSKILLETTYKNQMLQVKGSDLLTFKELPELSVSMKSTAVYSPKVVASYCVRQHMIACRHLLHSEDDALSMLLQNKIQWTREESLANIAAVEIVELPMSDNDQAIETEFDQKERDIVSMVIRRICSQFHQLRALLKTTFGEPQQSKQRADLVRDQFGLHKMIVIVTATGKLFGIETRKGEIIWQLRVPNIKGLTKETNKMLFYLQRGSRHFPHSPQCTLLAADKDTGEGVVFSFNPITGQTDDRPVKLGYKIKQSMLLQVATEDFLRSIILLDDKDRVHVVPKRATAIAATAGKSTYIFTADQETGVLSGFSLSYSTSKELIAHKVWELVLSPKNQKIVKIASKNPIERVHSQGRVLNDRSVLYKYINPNLVAIITQGVGSVHKNNLNLYLLDIVSGGMIFSMTHKKVRGPIHMVHSENWLVYSYFNEKSRRTEVATVELYEGKSQSNTTVFSSLATAKLPFVERQAYIFPATIEAMQETITEKGITSKHILVALANGGISELPWMVLDPRRPKNPEFREEGVIPYIPEIQVHAESIINYNQSVFRVSGIHTSPSGLESTCLVFVHGLDHFYTRVAPSKTFDVLKDDFDYYLIVLVLSALMISSYATKKLASQKVQKQAWK